MYFTDKISFQPIVSVMINLKARTEGPPTGLHVQGWSPNHDDDDADLSSIDNYDDGDINDHPKMTIMVIVVI